MSTQKQPAASDAGEPTAAVAPSGRAINPVESRAIISEFFRPGDKDYAPKDFIQAVRAKAREAKDDTVAAMVARGDDTVIVPDIRATKATELAGLAWSDDDDETVLYDDNDDDRTTFWLSVFVAAAAVTVIVAGVVLWFVLSHHDRAAQTPVAAPIHSGPDDQVVPAPVAPSPPVAVAPPVPTQTVTVTPTPEAAPPAQTLAPSRPSTAALDEQFLNDLTRAGMVITDVPAAIYGGHDTCAYLAAGHTEPEAVSKAMSNNASMTRANAITAIDSAIAVYCPQYGG